MGPEDQSVGNGERRAERLALDEAARLRPNDWSSLEIQMLDLSAFGFRARGDARLTRGGVVSLDIPGIGSVDAQVEWQRGDQFGARFFDAIDLERCGWSFTDRRRKLARLLVERAGANRSGRRQADAQLRRKILAALPMQKGGVTA
jgi:hypothetical protein